MKKIVIQGFPYDEKSSFQKGAALAPPLIRKALYADSMNLYAENGKLIKGERILDLGDFTIDNYFEIEKLSADHLMEADLIFSLGGDHSITYPIVKAVSRKFQKIDILHIDAHADLYQEYEGDPYSHACPFARIMEDKLAERLVQFGIRTLNPHQKEQIERFGVEVNQMEGVGSFEYPKFENPVYLSLDLDGFDPAYAPGVSHHEAGGLSSRQVIDLIRNFEGTLVGADLVEYNPHRDHQDMTAYLSAKLMKEIIGRMLKDHS